MEENRRSETKIQVWRRCSAVLGVLLVGAVILLALCVYKLSNNTVISDSPQSPQAIRSTEDLSGSGLDLRVNPNSSCQEPYCYHCSSKLIPVIDQKGHFHCDVGSGDDLITKCCPDGGSRCTEMEFNKLERFLSDDYIDADVSENCMDHLVEETCCKLSILCPENYCNGGTCVCTGHSSELRCQCPPGKTGERCEQEVREEVSCDCFLTEYKFCGEETMPECEDLDKEKKWSECHMTREVDGVDRNCRCTSAGRNVSGLPTCEGPNASKITGSATYGRPSVVLALLAVLASMICR